MAGRPPEIPPGSERWMQLKRWCLPAPRGEGLDAGAAHARAQEQGWNLSYHTIYRTRVRVLEQTELEQVEHVAEKTSDVLVETSLANDLLQTPSPARGRFTL